MASESIIAYLLTTYPNLSAYLQCCGSMTFWCRSGSGSGSADPCLWLLDPDPAIFVIDPPPVPTNNNFSCLLLYEGTGTFTSFFKEKKVKKKSQSSRNQGFLTCLVIEGSGSIPLINGSGSGSRRPKNIGIRNTAYLFTTSYFFNTVPSLTS